MRPSVRRLAAVVAAAAAALAASAAPASATFHLNMVNEVMLASGSGDRGVQFVELLDDGGTEEAFTPVFAPYDLVIYDGAANTLGTHQLDPSGLRAAAAADRPYLISTPAADAAFGVTGDERLDVALPAGAGQACFEANPTPPAFSCMTWGPISRRVPTNSMGTGSVSGPLPAAGLSDQRQPDGSVVAAPPTPKARNTGAVVQPQPQPQPRPGPGTPPRPRSARVSFAARRARVDRRGRALVRLRCAGAATCRGTLSVRRPRGATVVGRRSFVIRRGRTATVAVPLASSVRRSLRGHRRVKLRAVASLRGPGRGRRTATAVLTLAR